MGGYLMGMNGYSYTVDRYQAAMDRAPIQTFLNMCAEIEKLKKENNRMRERLEEWEGANGMAAMGTTDLDADSTSVRDISGS